MGRVCRNLAPAGRRAVLLAAALLLAAARDGAAADPAGRWRGVVTLASGEVEILVELRETGGAWSGTLAAPALALADLALSDLEIDGRRVAFTAAGLGNGVRLTGELDAEGEVLRGEAAEGPAAGPPATDIFLFAVDDLAAWTPSPPENLTDRDGYDNQPFFLPDGSAILYTSIRDGQADIYRYSLTDGSTARLTDTPESEYSPTPMPDGSGFSTVRVEADGRQRLWAFRFDGGDPLLLIESVEPVGYHAWLGEFAVALFVLGDPPTLQVFDRTSGEARQLAAGIGRSLHAVPGSGQLSFVRKVGDRGFIEAYDPWIDKGSKLVETRPGSEDLTWTADGRILMGEGARLYLYRPGPQTQADPWDEIADLEPFGVRGVTRLALAPDQRRLAVVGERAVAPPSPPPATQFELRRR